jgi:hypothetical protein
MADGGADIGLVRSTGKKVSGNKRNDFGHQESCLHEQMVDGKQLE